ncbi:MAG: biopolymer transporter ExbD [Filimonas sp.]|nr:biopolymer transporter ExbD [Filimonas sp.]
MAEIMTADKGKGKSKAHPRSTKVDLTPMVDLGFLLITFFIFTAVLTEPKAMKLALPADPGKDTPPPHAGETATLQLVLGPNSVGYYNGDDSTHMQFTDYSSNGIRKVIMEKRALVKHVLGNEKETIVIIKPSVESSYKQVVSILDEMLITNVTRYVLTDATIYNERLLATVE